MRRFYKFLLAVLICGIFVFLAPSAWYRYSHWPREVDYAGLVAFADQHLKTSSANTQISKDLWPDAVRKLKPVSVYLNRGDFCVSIVLHHGGVFRGDTEFRVVPSDVTPDKISPSDIILSTPNPRVFRIDLQY